MHGELGIADPDGVEERKDRGGPGQQGAAQTVRRAEELAKEAGPGTPAGSPVPPRVPTHGGDPRVRPDGDSSSQEVAGKQTRKPCPEQPQPPSCLGTLWWGPAMGGPGTGAPEGSGEEAAGRRGTDRALGLPGRGWRARLGAGEGTVQPNGRLGGKEREERHYLGDGVGVEVGEGAAACKKKRKRVWGEKVSSFWAPALPPASTAPPGYRMGLSKVPGSTPQAPKSFRCSGWGSATLELLPLLVPPPPAHPRPAGKPSRRDGGEAHGTGLGGYSRVPAS